MSSILDHVEQAVPRATVYGAMKGSPVFIGKYFREINPSSNATEYNYTGGERKITFIVASPDKTIFHDLRSAYLRFKIATLAANNKVSEPASNIFERIVVKMNGTVVEDISRLDYLTSAFKNKLLTREQKNARKREGYDYQVLKGKTLAVAAGTDAGGSKFAYECDADGIRAVAENSKFEASGKQGDELCIKLDMSGIMNVQQLLSGYYSPLEIELYIQDPNISCELLSGASDGARASNIVIQNPRLCMEQIVMSPEYVSAFESALLSNSNAQGIQIPFSTYYTYSTDIKATDQTFWVRKPVRYLRSIYWANTETAPTNQNNYRFFINRPANSGIAENGSADRVTEWDVAIGTKKYRSIRERDATNGIGNESEIFFAKAVGHYNDYMTESDEIKPAHKKLLNSVQGLDLEYSPDNDVLASETTLNSNDVRLTIKKTGSTNAIRTMVFLNYQASIALFPGNETRLLVT